jgi:hypothetical protein
LGVLKVHVGNVRVCLESRVWGLEFRAYVGNVRVCFHCSNAQHALSGENNLQEPVNLDVRAST